MAQVQASVVPGRRSAGHQPAIGCQATQAIVPSRSADMLENNIDAASGGKVLYLVTDFLARVIHDMVGA